MPKTILLVDPDVGLRAQVAKVLQTESGYQVLENPDGKDVAEQVRSAQPSAIVLNVELPKGSGYAICSKLRKDEALKHIPVLLTSSDATPKAFEDHKKLKFGRANDYLLKPFPAETLAERVMALLGETLEQQAPDESLGLASLANEFGDQQTEERISIDDVEEISVDDDLAPTPETLPSDHDLDMLDTAFEKLEDVPADEPTSIGAIDELGTSDEGKYLFESPPGAEPVPDPAPTPGGVLVGPDGEVVGRASEQRAAAPSPVEARSVSPVPRPPEEATNPHYASQPPIPPAAPHSNTRDRDYFQAKEKLAQRERDLMRLRDELTAKERELVEQREHELEVERELATKDEEITRRDQQLRQLQQKVDALVAGQRRAEKDLATAREEARSSTQKAQEAESAKQILEAKTQDAINSSEQFQTELADARQRSEDLDRDHQKERSRADELEAEVAGVRAQLEESGSSLTDLRRQIDQERSEHEHDREVLRERLSAAEDEKQQSEEQVVKAYQRIKDDEGVREKARKALLIALQLLEEQAEERPPGERRA